MYGRVTRRAFVAGCATGIAGCARLPGGGTQTATPDNPAFGDAEETGDLALSSPAFDDGAAIPEKYGRQAANVNPPLRIAGVPEGAGSLALVVDDPDAVEPGGKVWVHWLVWNVDPGRTEMPEGWDAGGAVEGENDFGNTGYDGPDPPDDTHTYRFKLYALDATLDLPAGETKAALGRAMTGAVVGRTQLEGTYSP